MSALHALIPVLVLLIRNTGEEDFRASPVNITFEPGGNDKIPVTIVLLNDDITEVVQTFVAILKLQSAINPALVNITDARFATVCRIIDDDRESALTCTCKYLVF